MSTGPIVSIDDVLDMLDSLLREQRTFDWDTFYENRDRPIPFFRNVPDEHAALWVESQALTPGRVLELGCGPGRNAVFFASKGFRVDAVDMSEEALRWARERATERNVDVTFLKQDLFELEIEAGGYDLVYDSGCLHHIPPHRRPAYLELVDKALKPGGHYAVSCFVVGGPLGGRTATDLEVYRERSMRGGLGFTEEKLRAIFRDYRPVEIRPMRPFRDADDVFGVEGLLVGLFRKPDSDAIIRG